MVIDKNPIKIKRCLSKFEYFDTWDETEIRECCGLAMIRQFGMEEIILGDDIGDLRYAYFITKGSCCLIDELKISKRKERGITKYELLPNTGSNANASLLSEYSTISENSNPVIRSRKFPKRHGRFETEESRRYIVGATQLDKLQLRRKENGQSVDIHFKKICDYRKLSLFNLGEELFDRFVISSSCSTECLMVPIYWILEKNRTIWHRVRFFYNRHIPSKEAVFKRHPIEEHWTMYKKKLVDDLLAKSKKPISNSYPNVPLTIRLMEADQFISRF